MDILSKKAGNNGIELNKMGKKMTKSQNLIHKKSQSEIYRK